MFRSNVEHGFFYGVLKRIIYFFKTYTYALRGLLVEQAALSEGQATVHGGGQFHVVGNHDNRE